MGLKMHHFVLVHGSGHGAWCWVKLVSALEKEGHLVTAVNLASAGEDTEVADNISSLEQYDGPLEDLLASFPDEEKVILVGHSLAGFSLTRMSELFPKKISVAVYLAAFMPAPGQDVNELRVSSSFLQSKQHPILVPIDFEVKLNSEGEGAPFTSMEFPYDTLRDYFYNKCSPEDLAFATSRARRFPLLPPLFGPIAATEENYGKVPKVYVLSTHDRAINPYSARKMIGLNPPNEFHEIDADHSPFFSGLELVEKILGNVAAKYDSLEDQAAAPTSRNCCKSVGSVSASDTTGSVH